MTPTRCKNKKLTESREPTEVIMAPFSGKSIVLFEDVPVTKTAKRLLRIINPSEDDIEVSKCVCVFVGSMRWKYSNGNKYFKNVKICII